MLQRQVKPLRFGPLLLALSVLCALGCSFEERRLASAAASSNPPGGTGGSTPGVSLPGPTLPGRGDEPDGGLAGTGETPVGTVLSTNVSEFSLGAAVLGQRTFGQLVVRNAGAAASPAVSTGLAGEHGGDFSIVSSTCTSGLIAGGSCTLSLAFAPSMAGPRRAVLSILSAGAAPLLVQLSGAGFLSGDLTAPSSSYQFEPQEVGTQSAPFLWTVTNSGTASTGALTLTNSNPSAFVAANGCAAGLAPGASCSVSVTFLGPLGPHSTSLLLTDGTSTLPFEVAGLAQYRLDVVVAGTGTVSGRTTLNSSAPGLSCTSNCPLYTNAGRVALSAATTNGSASYFVGWSVADCPGPTRFCSVDVQSSLSVTATFLPMTNNLIFVSSPYLSSTLGGTSAYDAECNRAASEAGINNTEGNAYIAALSGPVGLLARLRAGVHGWVRLDGRPVFDRLADVLSAQAASPHYSVRYSASGERVSLTSVWSGTNFEGNASGTCSNWASASPSLFGTQGAASSGPNWLSSADVPCDTSFGAVYCLGNTQAGPLSVPTYTGKRIWVTKTNYVLGSMSPDQKCQSDRPAGVSRAVALLAYAGRPATAVLDPVATYVRPDGQLVGTRDQIADLSLSWLSAPWVFADGTVSRDQPKVWTGSPTPGEAARGPDDNCADWSTTSGTTFIGNYGDDSSGWSTGFFDREGCSISALLYCAEP